MDKSRNLAIRMELIWWIATIVVVAGVLYPILTNTESYPFLLINILYIVAFITYTRHIFLLKHTALAKAQLLKVVIILVSIPIVFYLIHGINYFQTFIDENGMGFFKKSVSPVAQEQLGSFIRNEMILFGTGSVIAALILPFRLVLSLWRWKNRGTV